MLRHDGPGGAGGCRDVVTVQDVLCDKDSGELCEIDHDPPMRFDTRFRQSTGSRVKKLPDGRHQGLPSKREWFPRYQQAGRRCRQRPPGG